jgi:plasmid stabilization system protein ParE
MAYRIHINEDAETEIEQIMLYIAQDSPQGAVQWLDELMDIVNALDLFPNRCPLAPESDSCGGEIRQQLHGSYRILFKIIGRTVHILHVRHGAREPLDEL